MIKSFSIFESKDDGYFKDMGERISEDFPGLRVKSYSNSKDGILEIDFFGSSKSIDFVEFVTLMDFWIEVLDKNKYQFEKGNMSLSREFHGYRNKEFPNWRGMRKYILQFGGQEGSHIRSMKIGFI
jgi:hypothetical protein